MDPFSALPLEVCLSILERLINLRDLQSALLSSRSLYKACSTSRKLVRQRVFFNQTRSIPAAGLFSEANRYIENIELKDVYDGVILREALWPCLVAYQECFDGDRLILIAWSHRLTAAYWESGDGRKAHEVDKTVWQHFCSAAPDDDDVLRDNHFAYLTRWLRTIVLGCARHGNHEYGIAWCDVTWDRLIVGTREQWESEMIDVIGCLCTGHVSETSKPVLGALVRKGWKCLHHRNMDQNHRDGRRCWYCVRDGKILVQASRSAGLDTSVILACEEIIWTSTTVRTPAFDTWAWLILDTHTNIGTRHEGALQVWARLRELPDESVFESYDLGWAREVICELRKRGSTKESLEFQASVLEMFRERTPQYFAFGRNLAEGYVRKNALVEALEVREQMWRGLTPDSKFYMAWGMALMDLHRKMGREDDATIFKHETQQALKQGGKLVI